MFVVAGPCVIEGEAHALAVSGRLADIARRLGVEIIFKSSFDKANRSSAHSFRGPGLDEGLKILAKVKAETGLRTITDVHEVHQVAAVAQVVDWLQVPAFLCRQTDLVQTAVKSGLPVLVKKGQFMAPDDMRHVVEKARQVLGSEAAIGKHLMLCERGTSFGYHDLVVDMRSLAVMREFGCPVVFDMTHSVQRPGAGRNGSGGNREMGPVLAKAAVAAGIDGLFVETHPAPEKAMSDAATVWPLEDLEPLLDQLLAIDNLVRRTEEQTTAHLTTFG